MKNYTANENDSVTFVWNHLMAQLQCCGVDNFRDFAEAEQWKSYTQKVVPEACCVLQQPVFEFKPVNTECVYNPSEANSYLYKVRTLCQFISLINKCAFLTVFTFF